MILFIGGPPRVGKGVLTRNLSKKLGIPYISTDALRQAARELPAIPKTDNLFKSEPLGEGDNQEEFFNNTKVEDIIDFQNKESEEVARLVKGIVGYFSWSKEHYIIEGVALLPRYYTSEFIKENNIIFIAVGNTNFDTFFKFSWDHRVNGDWLGKTSKEAFEKVIKFSAEFSKIFQNEANKFGYPYYEVNSKDFNNHMTTITEEIVKKIRNIDRF
jgi:2-phosphoglycerate kinase